MSDIKKRLDLLRHTQKKAKPSKDGETKEPGISQDTQTAPPVIEKDTPRAEPDDPAKKATLDRLRNLIAHVEKSPISSPSVRSPGGAFGDSVEALNRKPLQREVPVWDQASLPGAGLLEPELFEGPGQSIEDLIPGEYLQTPNGPCFRVRTEYPWFFHQGNIALSTLLDLDPAQLGLLTGDPAFAELDYRKTLFFDTETTGLDTGAGVYIFLAGLGFFEDRTFVVEQYFMRDFPEEPAVLHALSERMASFEYLVTYNGKTYDWPLLESRFAMNRRPIPMQNPRHLDLLHGTRRLFRHRLENCKLPTVEAGVIGLYRIDDLPGALLPERYFRYVRSRDARFIHKAFAHNAHDIVSMAAILASVIQILENPLEPDTLPAADIYAVARLLDAAGQDIAAVPLYTEALRRGLPSGIYSEALQQLSLVHKRQGNWEAACRIWCNMVQTASRSGIFPYVELAKYYEHQTRNFDEAMKWAESALQALQQAERIDRSIKEQLEHRRRRIDAKRRGEPWKPGISEEE